MRSTTVYLALRILIFLVTIRNIFHPIHSILFIHLFIHPSIHLSIYLSIHSSFEWMNKFGKCFTIKFRNDLIFRRWCVRVHVSLDAVLQRTSFTITGWYIVVVYPIIWYICIHHPFICNSNCWKHLISLACFMTFLTLKWQQLYAQVGITHHCVIFLNFMAADARIPIMGVYDKFSAN